MNDETKHRQYMVGAAGSGTAVVQPDYKAVTVPGPLQYKTKWRSGLMIVNGIECRMKFTLVGTDKAAMGDLAIALDAALDEVFTGYQP